MKQLGLAIDLNRCIGCKTCIVACRNYHDLVDPTTAVPNHMPYYLRVEGCTYGAYPEIAADAWVVPCQHCPDPQCLLACPERAIAKDAQTGIVQIDPDKCNGCGAIPGKYAAEKIKFAPCVVACPAHMNVEGYVRLAANGKFAEALQLMKETNPLPAVCGRVCHHPCESECKRKEVDEAVAINHVKRFLADRDLMPETRFVPTCKWRRPEKVAVIGSGPAGLSCAFYLAREGYPVTIFEKAPIAGGMLTLGIPSYRLPRQVVEAEIQVIRDMGVEIKTGVEIGKRLSLDKLRRQGFQAFFLAVGTQKCKQLDIKGENLKGVWPALDFLRKVNMGEKVALGKKVAVIGGGNAAVDAARSARRLGAAEAFILYRRGLEEMPARPEELEELQQEGIPIHTLTQPVRLIGSKGKVTAVECIKMKLGKPDKSGRGRPLPIRGSEFTIDVDAVIVALGQESDWSCLGPDCACKLTRWGSMRVDETTLQSNEENVFSGGDAVRGSASVIEAIADGKQAAISIDRYLNGQDLAAGRARVWEAVADVQKIKYDAAKRAKMPCLPVAQRLESFAEVQQGLSEAAAVQEGKRCLGCGLACVQACPYGVIQFNTEQAKAHKCDLCTELVHAGEQPVCVETCLTDAISFGELELLKQRLAEQGMFLVEELSRESVLYVE